jgi:hypothetical protein
VLLLKLSASLNESSCGIGVIAAEHRPYDAAKYSKTAKYQENPCPTRPRDLPDRRPCKQEYGLEEKETGKQI